MSVEINKVNDRQYTINGKVAQLDMNENWICVE
jgi:predicted RNA-binding protein